MRTASRARGGTGTPEARGIPHLRFHDLRHTAGTRLVNAGVELQTVRKIMGHASLATTQRYLHSSDKQQQRAVEALAGGFDEFFGTITPPRATESEGGAIKSRLQ